MFQYLFINCKKWIICEILIIERTQCGIYGNAVYYFTFFSVNLNSCKIKNSKSVTIHSVIDAVGDYILICMPSCSGGNTNSFNTYEIELGHIY